SSAPKKPNSDDSKRRPEPPSAQSAGTAGVRSEPSDDANAQPPCSKPQSGQYRSSPSSASTPSPSPANSASPSSTSACPDSARSTGGPWPSCSPPWSSPS